MASASYALSSSVQNLHSAKPPTESTTTLRSLTERCWHSAAALKDSVNVGIADYVFTPFFHLLPGVAKKMGEIVGDTLVYPDLHPELKRVEQRFAQLAFDANAHSLSAPYKQEIKDGFIRSIHHASFHKNKSIKVKYLVLESISGDRSQPAHNIVLFPGNIGSIEVNQDVRAFARALLEKSDLKRGPQVRIIVVSARDIVDASGKVYKPPFAKTGQIHKAILDHLMHFKRYGKISQVVGISLGCAVVAKLMDAIDAESLKDYPQNWWLHVGPSSMEEVSKLYWFGRALLIPAARASGWDVDPASSLERFCKKIEIAEVEKQMFIGVSGLAGDADHHFPWKASLCQSDKVMALKSRGAIAEVLQFRPSHMEHHVRAHHALPLDAFDLIQQIDPATQDFVVHPLDKASSEKESFLSPGEHLAGAIVGQALLKNRRLD